ncbi:sortase-associated OmpA-like protein PdsO [Paraferrimonas sedimenticola]|uniref:OmpA-like domain-containing protein n=1 Tax=Paraferrimonas sedimenticola TaxID=375674 RepID=A0AA37S035_9GAMM|nr:sortase-associated OmpA-like protein PdsO [Paraferrimonas sedimenticola]GLP97912.1 hypothetical protein GCM10007895_32190 [Paraferrimonas sedimenticola]
MKKQLIAIALSTCLTLPAQAQSETELNKTPELVGMGSGALVGALVGGPVGLFVGAFSGIFIGKSVAHEDLIDSQSEQISQLSSENEHLMQTAQAYNQSQLTIARLQSELEQAQALSLAMNIQFRSGSAELEPHFKAQLAELAQLMHNQPQLKLELAGFADPTGDATFNQSLSEKRALAVSDFLMAQGVAAERLHAQGYGSQTELVDTPDYESNTFERRVAITSVIDVSQTAKSH